MKERIERVCTCCGYPECEPCDECEEARRIREKIMERERWWREIT